MGLFQKQPIVTSQPFYKMGDEKTFLIIGLGNPGAKYKSTRHNVGFAAVDKFAQLNDVERWSTKKDLKAEMCMHTVGDSRVILAKPATFMNDSGQAAAALQRFYKINNNRTLVIYDELAVSFGQLRSRVGGSDAGHNGVKSLISHIGEDFNRLRIGVANEFSQKADAADFVLGNFSAEEQEKLTLILREAAAIISEFIYSGRLPNETRTIT